MFNNIRRVYNCTDSYIKCLHFCGEKSKREWHAVCVPVVEGGRPGIPVNDTPLRSGSGMFRLGRLGRLGSGGRPAGNGIKPEKKPRGQCRSKHILKGSKSAMLHMWCYIHKGYVLALCLSPSLLCYKMYYNHKKIFILMLNSIH